MHKLGLKLVPLGPKRNEKTGQIEAYNHPQLSWTPIYENPQYWSIEKLHNERRKFQDVGTVFGKSRLTDDEDIDNGIKRDLYLHCLDIDSQPAHDRIALRLEDLKRETFVVKSRKPYGYHIYWFEHEAHSSVMQAHAHPGCEFEIKANKSCGHSTLPPSRHRGQRDFVYEAVGRTDKIAIMDGFYKQLKHDLLSDLLITVTDDPDSNKPSIVGVTAGPLTVPQAQESSPSPPSSLAQKQENEGRDGKALTENQIDELMVLLIPCYKPGLRDEIIFALSGMLFRYGISILSAESIILGLCESSKDNEKPSRLQVLQNTYLNGAKGNVKVSGTARLIEVISRSINDNQVALDIVGKIRRIFTSSRRAGDNSSLGDDDENIAGNHQQEGEGENERIKNEKIANKLVELVKANCPLLFVDQYNKPYVWARLRGRYRDVIPVESRHFETYISGLYYSECIEVASKEALANTSRIMAAKAIYGEDPIRKELHLRTGWRNKETRDEIHYDLTDDLRRCIRITKAGWEITQHTPDVLFRRFGQQPQVEPSREYPHGIFDQYLDLMHITDPQQRLVSKVLTTSYFIPDIAHPIDLAHGEKGSVKTTFCRCIKRLVDPYMPDLLAIPSDKREFAQQLYHNHLLLYDNVRFTPDWFSDEVCKAVTGGGISKRQLFTDDDDVVYDYKRCIIINGINIALIEPDALDRSIMSEYKRLQDDKRRSESEVLAEFERMKPQLLGYIMDILVKALRIRANLNLERLPRMADFAIWGEAIARAMGYKEFEFLDAYYANIGAQNVEAIEASLLGSVIIRFANNLILRATTMEKQENEKKRPLQHDNDYQTTGLLLWEGRAEDLLKALDAVAITAEFSIDTKKARDWPKKSNRLTKMLRPMLSNLREGYGIAITIESDTTGKNTDPACPDQGIIKEFLILKNDYKHRLAAHTAYNNSSMLGTSQMLLGNLNNNTFHGKYG